MKMLLLVPKIFPYSASLGNDVNIVAMASGMPRRRRTKIGATHKAKLEFTLQAEHYDYLMAFWRLTRDKTFACRMFSESSHLQWHSMQWLNAPTITNHGGGVFTFSCDVTTAKAIDKDRISSGGGGNGGSGINTDKPNPPNNQQDKSNIVWLKSSRTTIYERFNFWYDIPNDTSHYTQTLFFTDLNNPDFIAKSIKVSCSDYEQHLFTSVEVNSANNSLHEFTNNAPFVIFTELLSNEISFSILTSEPIINDFTVTVEVEDNQGEYTTLTADLYF